VPPPAEGKCALTVFTAPLAWEINKSMGCANEEDRGFRRVDEMCAARPLQLERFETMTMQEIADSITEEPE
jgi:hypothetical protein